MKKSLSLIVKQFAECRAQIQNKYPITIAKLVADNRFHPKTQEPMLALLDIEFEKVFGDPSDQYVAAQYVMLLGIERLLTHFIAQIPRRSFGVFISSYAPIVQAFRTWQELPATKNWRKFLPLCSFAIAKAEDSIASGFDLEVIHSIRNLHCEHLLILAQHPEILEDLEDLSIHGPDLLSKLSWFTRFSSSSKTRLIAPLSSVLSILITNLELIVNQVILPTLRHKNDAKVKSHIVNPSGILVYSVTRFLYAWDLTPFKSLWDVTIRQSSALYLVEANKIREWLKSVGLKSLPEAKQACVRWRHPVELLQDQIDEVDQKEKKQSPVESDAEKLAGLLKQPNENIGAQLQVLFILFSGLFKKTDTSGRLLNMLKEIGTIFFSTCDKEINIFHETPTARWLINNWDAVWYLLDPEDSDVGEIAKAYAPRKKASVHITSSYQPKDYKDFRDAYVFVKKPPEEKQGRASKNKARVYYINKLGVAKELSLNEKIAADFESEAEAQKDIFVSSVDMRSLLNHLPHKPSPHETYLPDKAELEKIWTFLSKKIITFFSFKKRPHLDGLANRFSSVLDKAMKQFEELKDSKDKEKASALIAKEACSAFVGLLQLAVVKEPEQKGLDKLFETLDIGGLASIFLNCLEEGVTDKDFKKAVRQRIKTVIDFFDVYTYPSNLESRNSVACPITQSEWENLRDFLQSNEYENLIDLILRCLKNKKILDNDRGILHGYLARFINGFDSRKDENGRIDRYHLFTHEKYLAKKWVPVLLDFVVDIINFAPWKKILLFVFSVLQFLSKAWLDIQRLLEVSNKEEAIPILKGIMVQLQAIFNHLIKLSPRPAADKKSSALVSTSPTPKLDYVTSFISHHKGDLLHLLLYKGATLASRDFDLSKEIEYLSGFEAINALCDGLITDRAIMTAPSLPEEQDKWLQIIPEVYLYETTEFKITLYSERWKFKLTLWFLLNPEGILKDFLSCEMRSFKDRLGWVIYFIEKSCAILGVEAMIDGSYKTINFGYEKTRDIERDLMKKLATAFGSFQERLIDDRPAMAVTLVHPREKKRRFVTVVDEEILKSFKSHPWRDQIFLSPAEVKGERDFDEGEDSYAMTTTSLASRRPSENFSGQLVPVAQHSLPRAMLDLVSTESRVLRAPNGVLIVVSQSPVVSEEVVEEFEAEESVFDRLARRALGLPNPQQREETGPRLIPSSRFSTRVEEFKEEENESKTAVPPPASDSLPKRSVPVSLPVKLIGTAEYILLAVFLILGLMSFALVYWQVVALSLLPLSFLAGFTLLESAAMIGGAIFLTGALLVGLSVLLKWAFSPVWSSKEAAEEFFLSGKEGRLVGSPPSTSHRPRLVAGPYHNKPDLPSRGDDTEPRLSL